MRTSSSLALGLGLAKLSEAAYSIQDDYTTDSFFSMFDFFTDSDPTNGYVDYVSQSDASSAGLINTDNGQVYIGVDASTTLTSSSSGRQSVRLSSTATYTHGLVVLDLDHMPNSACGSWPAFWMVGPNWPAAGEIDIIEGVNEDVTNSMTLHTGSGCSVVDSTATSSLYAGYFVSAACSTGQNSENGCQIATTDTTTYGDGFNNNGGGIYAMEWTSDSISIWHFSHANAPSDISGSSPDPSSWATPLAVWGNSACDLDQHFYDHQIVFDLTFCGDWAGQVWSSSTCSSKADTCIDYVMNNPTAFSDAYWTINSLKVYVDDGVSVASTGTGAASGASSTAAAGQQSQTVAAGASSSVPVIIGQSTSSTVAAAQTTPFVPAGGSTTATATATDGGRGGPGGNGGGNGNGIGFTINFNQNNVVDATTSASTIPTTLVTATSSASSAVTTSAVTTSAATTSAAIVVDAKEASPTGISAAQFNGTSIAGSSSTGNSSTFGSSSRNNSTAFGGSNNRNGTASTSTTVSGTGQRNSTSTNGQGAFPSGSGTATFPSANVQAAQATATEEEDDTCEADDVVSTSTATPTPSPMMARHMHMHKRSHGVSHARNFLAADSF